MSLLLIIITLCAASASFLLIAVQMPTASLLLPKTGGHPYIWNALQALFQGTLLIGYLVSIIFSPFDRTRLQGYALLVAGCGLVSLLSVKVGIETDGTLFGSMVGILLSVGTPFIGLATCSISLQLIFAGYFNRRPSLLFAIGNVASILAVLTFVVVVEPIVGASVQLWSWRIATGVVLVVLAGCLLVLRTRRGAQPGLSRISWPELARVRRWYLLGALGVALSLSCTSYLAVDLGSHPAVWSGPFAVYLLSMALAFGMAGRWQMNWTPKVAAAASGSHCVPGPRSVTPDLLPDQPTRVGNASPGHPSHHCPLHA